MMYRSNHERPYLAVRGVSQEVAAGDLVGITESVKLTSPPDFTVVLKKRLISSIGDRFASSDVKFSFDRQPQIADQNGPSTLFYEEGTGAEVLGAPKHPYTRRLLASLPVPNPAERAIRRETLRMLRAED